MLKLKWPRIRCLTCPPNDGSSIRRFIVVPLVVVIPTVLDVNPRVVTGVLNDEAFDHLSVEKRHS